MNPTHDDNGLGERLRLLESRLAQIEKHLGLEPSALKVAAPGAAPAPVVAATADPTVATPEAEEADFEYEVGQNWFAKVGIMVLALGVAFTLALPYAQLPAWIPSLAGYVVTAGLFALSHYWRKSFELLAKYFHGSGMALLFFSTLRLIHFGEKAVIGAGTAGCMAALGLAVAVNLVIARRRNSGYLYGLALSTGYVALYAAGSVWFFLAGLVALTALAVEAKLRTGKVGLLFLAIIGGFMTYLAWSAGHSFQGDTELAFADVPSASPAVLLLCAVILAGGSLFRPERSSEDTGTIGCSVVNCAFGYGVFLIHSLAILERGFAPAHLAAALVLIGVALAFWHREKSRFSTFVYAMTGYMALSIAIMKSFPMPSLFVWLSLQSLVVVTTAIWFRSRFIVVANFLIYLMVVGGYMLLAKGETGISLWFGVVALLSARILNWQQSRLELKTALMRNAYLFSAFVIFPYALYHLVPVTYVGLAWVGIALFYYAMNLMIRNLKYRWMGHCTLLLTAIYLVAVGARRFDPVYRNLTFLVLGVVLLVVSLIFTSTRMKAQKSKD